jgi:hypothetical protein
VNGYAVILLNANDWKTISVTLDFKMLGISGGQKMNLRDLWLHKDLGVFQDHYTATSIPPHDIVMLKLSPA